MPGPSDYTVGWICALQIEYLAAQLCLDEEHDDLSINASAADNNDYTLGKIGKHNVVIAVLPKGEYGTTSAASVAKDMLHTFPNVRVGLMVGIGGGVPTKHDIRLGDIVVSAPKDGSSGVYHYGFGKTVQGRSFVNTGVLNQPPSALRAALQGLETQYERKGHHIEERINEILAKERPVLRQKYSRPDLTTDKLFKPDLIHDDICGNDAQCVHNEDNLVFRRVRAEFEDSPAIHYGTIASGNRLIKDAIVRDKLSKEKDVLCFEMEAAGLMNPFPCLVIRGICDYSDSHKNTQWQRYAALTAALYAKDLVSRMSPSRANAEQRIVELLSSVGESVSRTEKKVSNVESRLDKREGPKIRDWFSSFDHGLQLAGVLDRRAPETGEWFLKSPEFMGWLEGPRQTLFCPGMPGAGKTIIASIVVDYLYNTVSNESNVGVAFAFLNYEEPLSSIDLLSRLLKQLIPGSAPPMVVTDLYKSYLQNGTRPSSGKIFTTLCSLAASYSKTFIVIDALDESPVPNRQGILADLFRIQDTVGAKLLATGRSISEIVEAFQQRQSTFYEIRARDDDVHRFITNQLETFEGCISEAPELNQAVADTITKATDGMFLLAHLYLEVLRDQTTITQTKDTLRSLPTGSTAYHQTYDKIMARINDQATARRRLAIEVLSWLTQSKRPVRLAELKHALAVENDSLDVDKENIPSSRLIVLACVGLVIVDEARNTVRLVHSTTAEYFHQRWASWFPHANSYIATVCIKYLNFEKFCTPTAGNWLEYDARRRIDCLYEYAAVYWGDHAREAYPQVRSLVAELLRSGRKLLNAAHTLDISAEASGPFRGPCGLNGLHVASYFGLSEQIQELIQDGQNPKALDSCGRSALHWAAKSGQRQVVEHLARQGLDVNALDNKMESPLHYSARQGNRPLVELLIHLGSQVETRNSDGETALLVSASIEDIGGLEGLVTNGADPNATDKMGRSALHLAITARNGSHAAVKLLLSYGVSIDLCDANNMMPLHYAVAEGKNEIIDWLLEAGANINLGVQRKECSSNAQSMSTKEPVPVARTRDIGDGIGLTPLHFAACSGHSRMTRYLLEKGANPNACCCYGETPLHIAIREGLFNPRGKGTGAPYPLVCNDPWTDSRWNIDGVYDIIDDYESDEAVEINAYVEEERLAVVNALLDSPKIDVNIQNIHLDSPLHLLKYDHHTSARVFGKLLDRGADIFSCNDKGQTALHFACKAGALSIVKVLLGSGCSISTPDHDGLSALHFAVRSGQFLTVKSIFSMEEEQARTYCLDVDAKGRTLLHHLLQDDSSHMKMTGLLLAYSGSPSCTDNDGNSPLSTYLGTFKFGNRTAICRLLLQHGGNPSWTSPAQLTLAHLAVSQYKAETGVLEALSAYGLDLSIKDASGKGILHRGAIGGSLSLDILNFLHDRNLLDPYDRDVDGKTPLDYASEEAQKERHPDLFCGSRWNESLKALQGFIEMKYLL